MARPGQRAGLAREPKNGRLASAGTPKRVRFSLNPRRTYGGELSRGKTRFSLPMAAALARRPGNGNEAHGAIGASSSRQRNLWPISAATASGAETKSERARARPPEVANSIFQRFPESACSQNRADRGPFFS